jgi:hypothetical protein
LKLGNVTTAITSSFTDIGHTPVFLDATLPTTITDDAGVFEIGATDASVLQASGTSELVMFLPATGGGVGGDQHGNFPENSFLVHGITVTASATDTSGPNLLLGSSGTLALDTNGNGFVGGIAADTITGGKGADNIFGMGGNDDITLKSAGTSAATDSTVWIGVYHEGGNPGTNFVQAITDIVGGTEIGVNGYLGVLSNVTTVHNFVLGPTGDVLNFNPSSWATGVLSGPGFDFGLMENTFGLAIPHGVDATMGLISTPGAAPPPADITLDNVSTYPNAAALDAALKTATVGDISSLNPPPE